MGKHGGRGVGSDGGMGGGLGGGVVCVCGESVDLGGAGARQVDHGEGHTDRRVVRSCGGLAAAADMRRRSGCA